MQLEVEYHNLTKAQLARKLSISRARVTQMLNLLKLPDILIREVEEMGDHWVRRLVTERMLRHLIERDVKANGCRSLLEFLS